MKSNSKVYCVYEFGEEYTINIGVCSSLELANKLREEYIASKKLECNINSLELHTMLDYLYYYEDKYGEIGEIEEDGLKKLFPNKDPKDIEIACKLYFSCGDYPVYILEMDYYENN